MNIYCCSCKKEVVVRLTSGEEIYPHRTDLKMLPFWVCDVCTNYVGCHHKTKNRTKPLGVIATREIMKARGHIHKLIDPAWKGGTISRKELYALMSIAINKKYHTAEIRSIEEARSIYVAARKVIKTLTNNNNSI